MKILHLVGGNISSGAGKGAYSLHQGLIELGIDSLILTNSRTVINDAHVKSIYKGKRAIFANHVRSFLDQAPVMLYRKRKKALFSPGLIGFNFKKTYEYQAADIVHLHWINNGFVNIRHLTKIHKPIVWTLRDMWPMTGGCHYAIKCDSYKWSCGKCSQLNSNSSYDLSKFIFKRKRKFFPKNITVVGISSWLSQTAKGSALFSNHDVTTICNNINTRDFMPIDKDVSRKILKINTSKKIISAGATDLKDYYKGFDNFLDALRLLDNRKYFLCFFGGIDKLSEIAALGFEFRYFGYFQDILSVKLMYSASDVFVAPSIMDAFGKTIAESMACGTPAVCYDATGPKDIVTHMIDGYKAIPYEAGSLAEGITWVSSHPNYEQLSANARNKIVLNFDSGVIAKKYIELYENLLDIKRNGKLR